MAKLRDAFTDLFNKLVGPSRASRAKTPESVEETKTYEILEEGRAIKCLVCGLTSWHPKDIAHRYCDNCSQFHDDRKQASVAER